MHDVRPQSDALDLVESMVWAALQYLTQYGPASLDALVQRTRLPRRSVTFALGDLMTKGLVTVDDQQLYAFAVNSDESTV